MWSRPLDRSLVLLATLHRHYLQVMPRHCSGLPFACSLWLSAPGCGARTPTTLVVLVSIDTPRPDHLGVYGYPRATSPSLDAFREDAVAFRNAFSHASLTLYSHASIRASLLPLHQGASIANDLALPREVLTLASSPARARYATASFNGGLQLDAVRDLDQGFDTYQSAKPHGAPAEGLVGGGGPPRSRRRAGAGLDCGAGGPRDLPPPPHLRGALPWRGSGGSTTARSWSSRSPRAIRVARPI